MVVDGTLVGGKSNTLRGEHCVLIGGKGLVSLTDIAEDGSGIYSRYSVLLGGMTNTLPADVPDGRTLLGIRGPFTSEPTIPRNCWASNRQQGGCILQLPADRTRP